MVLVGHVILQDHVIKASYDFMSRSRSTYANILPRLVPIIAVVLGV